MSFGQHALEHLGRDHPNGHHFATSRFASNRYERTYAPANALPAMNTPPTTPLPIAAASDLPPLPLEEGAEDVLRGFPDLRMTEACWIKVDSLVRGFQTEVSCMAICDEPFHIVDIIIPKQRCSSTWTEFDDEDLAIRTARICQEQGLQPWQVQRIWIHTHPGGPSPSSQDWDTFNRLSQGVSWFVMFIAGKNGEQSVNARASGTMEVPGLGKIAVAHTWQPKFIVERVGWPDRETFLTDVRTRVGSMEYASTTPSPHGYLWPHDRRSQPAGGYESSEQALARRTLERRDEAISTASEILGMAPENIPDSEIEAIREAIEEQENLKHRRKTGRGKAFRKHRH